VILGDPLSSSKNYIAARLAFWQMCPAEKSFDDLSSDEKDVAIAFGWVWACERRELMLEAIKECPALIYGDD
jgi:hypothetical protein